MSEFFVWHSKFGKNPEFGIRLISKGEGEIMNIWSRKGKGIVEPGLLDLIHS